MLSKRTLSQTLLLLAGFSFLFAACGDEGRYSRWDEIYPSSLNAFRVLWSDPDYNQELVSLSASIIVRFNERVDPTSIDGAIRVEERTAAGISDITSQGSLSTQNADTEIIWRPNIDSGFVYGAFYQMTLSGSLRSITGRPLVATTYVPFYTGTITEFGPGVYSLPGPPQVQSMDLQLFSTPYGQGGILVNIFFNEDIQNISLVRYKLYESSIGWDFFDQFNIAAQGIMTVERNPYSFDHRSFIAYILLPPGFNFQWLSKITVRIQDAIDMQGEHMGPYEKDLRFWD